MEETKWVVTSDFLKIGRQLKKKDEQLKAAKERVSFLERKEKSLAADIACMTERALAAEDERSRLQGKIVKTQVADPGVIKELQTKNHVAEHNLQLKNEELERQQAQYEQKIQEKEAKFKGFKAQIEEELRETKDFLEEHLANHSRAKHNWNKEMSSSAEQLASEKRKKAELAEAIISRDVEVTSLKASFLPPPT